MLDLSIVCSILHFVGIMCVCGGSSSLLGGLSVAGRIALRLARFRVFASRM